MQRSPPAPSHGGQTGVRDLAKIHVDAVPDFLIGSLSNPWWNFWSDEPTRVVNPHVVDPTIKSITWEFYDPADTMLSGSFSTVPASAAATTAPFTIRASQFGSGAAFVQGRYLLRLVGLDDQHRPVAYADSDFNVLTSDLTTGTGAATGHGELTFTEYTAHSAASATGRWTVDVKLAFKADPAVASTDIVFIQALEYVTADGRSFHRRRDRHRSPGRSTVSRERRSRSTSPGPTRTRGRSRTTRDGDRRVPGALPRRPPR